MKPLPGAGNLEKDTRKCVEFQIVKTFWLTEKEAWREGGQGLCSVVTGFTITTIVDFTEFVKKELYVE